MFKNLLKVLIAIILYAIGTADLQSQTITASQINFQSSIFWTTSSSSDHEGRIWTTFNFGTGLLAFPSNTAIARAHRGVFGNAWNAQPTPNYVYTFQTTSERLPSFVGIMTNCSGKPTFIGAWKEVGNQQIQPIIVPNQPLPPSFSTSEVNRFGIEWNRNSQGEDIFKYYKFENNNWIHVFTGTVSPDCFRLENQTYSISTDFQTSESFQELTNSVEFSYNP